MPLLEYRCEDCGTRFERLLRQRAAMPAPACPSCGQEERVAAELSTFAAQVTGTRPAPQPGGCGAGMCRTPDLCGRN